VVNREGVKGESPPFHYPICHPFPDENGGWINMSDKAFIGFLGSIHHDCPRYYRHECPLDPLDDNIICSSYSSLRSRSDASSCQNGHFGERSEPFCFSQIYQITYAFLYYTRGRFLPLDPLNLPLKGGQGGISPFINRYVTHFPTRMADG
jgi:hypothetical protein